MWIIKHTTITVKSVTVTYNGDFVFTLKDVNGNPVSGVKISVVLGKSKTLHVFESFVSSKENIQIIAISGRNEKMKLGFQEIVDKYNAHDFIRILGFTNQVPELMSISDLVVTKPGGLTTSESLASHLPMVIINPIPGQEEENAEFLESKRIAIWIRRNDDTNIIIKNLLSNEDKLNSMKENTSILAKPNSTRTICDVLLN